MFHAEAIKSYLQVKDLNMNDTSEAEEKDNERFYKNITSKCKTETNFVQFKRIGQTVKGFEDKFSLQSSLLYVLQLWSLGVLSCINQRLVKYPPVMTSEGGLTENKDSKGNS